MDTGYFASQAAFGEGGSSRPSSSTARAEEFKGTDAGTSRWSQLRAWAGEKLAFGKASDHLVLLMPSDVTSR